METLSCSRKFTCLVWGCFFRFFFFQRCVHSIQITLWFNLFWCFIFLFFPSCPLSKSLTKSCHILIPPSSQLCPQTLPPILFCSSSLPLSRLHHSFLVQPLCPGNTFPQLAQSQETLLHPLLLRRSKVGAVEPSRQPASGLHTQWEALPIHSCHHPWGPLTPRCTRPWPLVSTAAYTFRRKHRTLIPK